MRADFFINKDSAVICNLCPHNCNIKQGLSGKCGVRQNLDGILYSKVYGIQSAIAVDPIEKKPLYHFYPGSQIVSVGSFGCNLKCNFCQNHSISQISEGINLNDKNRNTPEQLVIKAKEVTDSIGIAFTYNEPTVWYEFMYDTAVLAKRADMITAMITNGFINPGPLNKLIPYIDAFNVDLKFFESDLYRHETGGRLDDVLKSLEIIAASGKHLEITNLVIAGLNDSVTSFTKMVEWIRDRCGADTILHLSKYFPNYNSNLPVTPDKVMVDLYRIAKKSLRYTYLGNSSISIGNDTKCPDCSAILIERTGYKVKNINTGIEGDCKRCGSKVFNDFTW